MTYQIADEPFPPTRLADLAVRPGAPLLASMICGHWLSWPWFAINAYAVGSPTRRRELAWCIAGFAGSALLGVLVFALIRWNVIESRVSLEVALLGVSTWKLAASYRVATLQERSFNASAQAGRGTRNPRAVLAVGFLVRATIYHLVDHPLWPIIIMGGAL
nr:hypothetical protein [Kofleriaceae bacterium]